MMIAARNSFLMSGGTKPWVNPYITDGLVAMWDGEWNAGGGVHDATATTWADVVAGKTITPTSLARGVVQWSNDSLTLSNAIALSQTTDFDSTEPFSIELVVRGTNEGYAFATSVAIANRVTEIGIYQSVLAVGVRNGYAPIKCGITSGTVSLVVGAQSQTCLANGISVNTRNITTGYGLSPIALGYSPVRGTPTQNGSTEYCSIRLYNRALTAAEVAANYAVDAARFNL